MKKIKEVIQREREKTIYYFRVVICILCYLSAWHLVIQGLCSTNVFISLICLVGVFAFWRAGGLFLQQIIKKKK